MKQLKLDKPQEKKLMNSFAKFLWGGLLVLAILLLSFSSYHATDSAEVGVRTVKWLGKKGVEDKFYQPGAAYFFLPIINEWDTYDTRLQVIEMKGPTQLTLKTKDGNDLYVDVTFSYRIDPKKAPFIRQFVAKKRPRIAGEAGQDGGPQPHARFSRRLIHGRIHPHGRAQQGGRRGQKGPSSDLQ